MSSGVCSTTATPNKIVELFKLGEGTPPTLGIRTADVVDGFYSFLGFPRLVSSGVVKKAIAKGIQDGFFAYYSGSTPVLGSDGKYQVPLARVRFNAAVSEDEIDLESGFLIMPQAVPVATPVPGSTGVESECAWGCASWRTTASSYSACWAERCTGVILSGRSEVC